MMIASARTTQLVVTVVCCGLLLDIVVAPSSGGELPKGLQLLVEGSARPKGDRLPDGSNSPHDLRQAIEGIENEEQFKARFPDGITLRDPDAGDRVLKCLSDVNARISEIIAMFTDPVEESTFLPQLLLLVNLAIDGGKLLADDKPEDLRTLLRIIFDPDPALIYDLTIENPTDEPMRMAFALKGDLAPISQIGDSAARLDAEVLDTGGDPGASLSVVQAMTTITEDPQGETANLEQHFVFGDATEGNPLSVTNAKESTAFVSLIDEQAVGMRIGTEFEVSAGDTVRLSGYFALGDEAMPILSDDVLTGLTGLLQSLEPVAGASPSADFDGDGDVDRDDFAIWAQHFGQGGLTPNEGDADGDQFARGSDFLTWQQQFGSIVAATAAQTVPEPTTAVLAVILLGGVCPGRLSKRRLHAILGLNRKDSSGRFVGACSR